MTAAHLHLLTLHPERSDRRMQSRAWLSNLADLSGTSSNALSISEAHSMRPIQLSVGVKSHQTQSGLTHRWRDRILSLSSDLDQHSRILESQAGVTTHLALLEASATDMLAVAMASGQLAGLGGLETVFAFPTPDAILALSDPFGKQVSGRIRATFARMNVDLICVVNGPAAYKTLDELGFVCMCDAPAHPLSADAGAARKARISLSKSALDRMVTSTSDDLPLWILGVLRKASEGPVFAKMTGDTSLVTIAPYLEELVLGGVDFELITEDAGARDTLDAVFQSSLILASAREGDALKATALSLDESQEWRRRNSASQWAMQLVRSPQDMLGHNIKDLEWAGTSQRIDIR